MSPQSMVGGYGLAENCVYLCFFFLFDSNRYVSDGGYTVLTIDKSSFEQNLVVPVQDGHDSVPTIALHSCGSVFKNPEITIKIVENEKEVDVFISIILSMAIEESYW